MDIMLWTLCCGLLFMNTGYLCSNKSLVFHRGICNNAGKNSFKRIHSLVIGSAHSLVYLPILILAFQALSEAFLISVLDRTTDYCKLYHHYWQVIISDFFAPLSLLFSECRSMEQPLYRLHSPQEEVSMGAACVKTFKQLHVCTCLDRQ